jgi:hypothetical protein
MGMTGSMAGSQAGRVYTGSASADAAGNRGWLLGHFMPAGDVRNSTDVEVKWGMHPLGDQRPQWVTAETRTALIILVSGRFRIEFPHRTVLLAEQGDYVVFEGVSHSWYADEESVIVAIRWPSIPGYALPESTTEAT